MTAKTSTTKSPFDFDMFKTFEQFKVPGFDIDAIMASQRKNIEAAAAANQRAFEGMSALVRRQGEVARESAEAGMKAFSEVSAASPEDRIAKQADFAKAAYSSFFANGREIFDMAAKTADEAIGLINDRVTANIEESKKVFASK